MDRPGEDLVIADGEEPPQESPVTKRDSARPISLDNVLIVLAHLNNAARSVPLVGVKTRLVLHTDEVPHFQGWKAFGVLGPIFSRADVAFAEGLLSRRQSLTPCGMGPVLAGGDRDEVPYRPSKETHRRRDLRVRVGRVAIV